MAKRTPIDLVGAMRKSAGVVPPQPDKAHLQQSRQDKSNVTGYYPMAVKAQLRHLAAAKHTTIQNLLAEALNDLFAKYGKPEITPHDGPTSPSEMSLS